MLINCEIMKESGIVQNGVASNYRAATYDLTVGVLLSPTGEQVKEYLIPPQGMLKVISAEFVRVPEDHVGYVLVKTSLCNIGLLALNIGVVDPGYEGPLSSTLINFGKSKHRIRNGDTFSRLTVHEMNTKGLAQVHRKPVSKEIAIKNATEQVDHYLGDTFLDLKTMSEKVEEETFEKYKSTLLWALPAFAFLIAVLTLLLNFGNMWLVYAYQKPSDVARTELLKAELDTKLNELSAKTSALSEQVGRLESAVMPKARKRATN